jgi:hypothetical protein
MSDYSNIKLDIYKIFIAYKDRFRSQEYKTIRLTEYEKAFGFNEDSRKGSKPFGNTLGYFMEEIWLISPKKIRKCNECGLDGISKKACFQFKNRYDTMKANTAYDEILPMIKRAIDTDKEFYLVVLVDEKNISRNIPLHKSRGLSKMYNLPGYNPDKHRMISDKYAYKYFFGEYADKAKKYILYLISTLN